MIFRHFACFEGRAARPGGPRRPWQAMTGAKIPLLLFLLFSHVLHWAGLNTLRGMFSFFYFISSKQSGPEEKGESGEQGLQTWLPSEGHLAF